MTAEWLLDDTLMNSLLVLLHGKACSEAIKKPRLVAEADDERCVSCLQLRRRCSV